MASVSGTRGFSAMRLSILGSYERRLAQGAAIIILGGLASGCSSDVMRFSYGSDGMFTGATSNQRQIIAPNQALSRRQPVPPAAVDGSHTGSVAREAVKPVDLSPSPVSHAPLAPVAGTTVAAADSAAAGQGQEPAPGAGCVQRRRFHRDRHREAGDRAAGRRGRSGRLVARRRHAGDRQGRRDDLQSVAPLRRAGRRADEDQRPVGRQRPAGRPEDRHPDLCLQHQGAGLGARQQSRRSPTRNRRTATRATRRPASCRRRSTRRPTRSRCCRSRRS